MAIIYEFNGSEAQIKLLDQDGNPADLKGAVKSVSLPEVSNELDTDPRIGEKGQVSRPLGVSAMEASMELGAVSVVFLEACQQAFTTSQEISVQITMPGKERNTGTSATQIVTMRGYVQRVPLPSEINPQEFTSFELGLAVNYIQQSLTGTTSTTWTFDARAQF